MTWTELLDIVAAYPRLAEIAAEPHEPRGIFNSEMAAVLAIAKLLDVTMVVESGRARGHSTRLLAKYLGNAGVEIHSFDREREADAIYAERQLRGLPNLHLHYGDSRIEIPRLLASSKQQRIALLIDGPKERKALGLLSECLIASDNIVVAFVHDLPRLKDGPTSARLLAEREFENPMFTDYPAFVERFRFLDALVPAGLRSSDLRRSYGPTLGIFVPTERDRAAAKLRGPSVSIAIRAYWAAKDRLRRIARVE